MAESPSPSSKTTLPSTPKKTRADAEHKSDSEEPELDEDDIDSYIISKPQLNAEKSKKSKRSKKEADENKEKDEKKETLYLPSTPKKNNGTGKSKSGKTKYEVVTPKSAADEEKHRAEESEDEIEEMATPSKKMGWLGYGGRQWAKGYSSPGKGW